MHLAPVYRSFQTTDVGGNANGQQLVGLQTVYNATVIGGSRGLGAWSYADYPWAYASRIKRRVLPLVGSNSEQIAFPPLVSRSINVMIAGLSGPQAGDKPPKGEWWAQRRQRPRPLWFNITGVTRNSTGTPVPGCTVKLYTTIGDLEQQSIVSDGGGNFAFWVSDSVTNFYAVAYLVGSPSVAGTTLNTLTGS